jgi:microcystin degradation protein MlrC
MMMMMRIRRAAILKAKVVISFLAADMAEILISIEKILVAKNNKKHHSRRGNKKEREEFVEEKKEKNFFQFHALFLHT